MDEPFLAETNKKRTLSISCPLKHGIVNLKCPCNQLLTNSECSINSKWKLFTTMGCSKPSYLCESLLTRFPGPWGLLSAFDLFSESLEPWSLGRPEETVTLALSMMQHISFNFNLIFTYPSLHLLQKRVKLLYAQILQKSTKYKLSQVKKSFAKL